MRHARTTRPRRRFSSAAGTSSRFVGYHEYERDAEILAASGKDGESIAIVVAETPFYPEGGGQVGDRGVIEAESGALLEVVDTRKAEGSIVHVGRLLRGEIGEFEKGRRVHLKVDRERRDAVDAQSFGHPHPPLRSARCAR